jgi:hypothetical protein
MRLLEIPEAKIKRYMPENLSECNSEQYMAMSKLIFKYQSGKITYEDLKIHAVYKLLKMRVSKRKLGVDDEFNKLSNLVLLSDLVESFFETNEQGQKIILQNYTNNPVPKITPLLTTYYGPTNHFNNVTFGEYTDALRLFLSFSATGDLQFLYLMAAVFYREKKSFHFIKKIQSDYDGDKRQPYNSKLIDQRAEKFKKADVGFIFGVYLLFSSFQKYITTANIFWGGKQLDLSILFENPEKQDQETPPENIPGIGMDSLLFTMAESGIFGTLDQVNKTNMWQIFVRMYDLRKRDLDNLENEKNNANSPKT